MFFEKSRVERAGWMKGKFANKLLGIAIMRNWKHYADKNNV